ncbi:MULTISPECIES: ABC transporter ATP-binding protein [Actinosynnema]|uniref:ABC transporter ATP-binding protein n=1 Tax=Actinosynnema TaxID=40566 RepID=UPI0020A38183|nr:ABC transporter ATP-binding protein [Actinosynnema pretiosum]MCP2094506.1 iron complex transport system ATP-binding protein [Actinosynnema pretiosum]
MRVHVSEVRVDIDKTPILHGVDLDVAPGSTTGLIGPNGSGKSTLLRCLYRALRPAHGVVLLGDKEVRRMRAREVGRAVAVVAQDHDLDNDFTARETAAMGRTPHLGPLDRESERDRDLVEEALERVGMAWAADRAFPTLSGGERQRVLLARALTQRSPVLLLDEPTNHLDVGAQLELLALVADLNLTTVTALHDLDHATAHCDELVLLHEGRVVASGKPEDVLTPDRVAEVFRVRSAVVPHPLTGRPHFVTAPLALSPETRRPR